VLILETKKKMERKKEIQSLKDYRMKVREIKEG